MVAPLGERCRRHRHPPVVSVADALEVAADLVEHLLKTVVFRVQGSERFVLAAVPHHARIDYRALAGLLGCSRRDLRLLPAEAVERDLGFQVGGVGPFPVRENVSVIIDAAVRDAAVVRCGSGLRTETLELSMADLLVVSGARVAAIARCDDGRRDNAGSQA